MDGYLGLLKMFSFYYSIFVSFTFLVLLGAITLYIFYLSIVVLDLIRAKWEKTYTREKEDNHE